VIAAVGSTIEKIPRRHESVFEVTLLARPPQRQNTDAEALIKEARALRRRRWLTRISIVVVLLTAIVVSLSVGLTQPKKSPISPGSSPERPLADVREFRGNGNLAFISRNTLWMLYGREGTLRKLPAVKGFSPTSPQLSFDGKWLAYLETRTTNYSSSSDLWIARGNGTDAHQVAKSVGALVGWSSTSDNLAYTSTSFVRLASSIAMPDKLYLRTPAGAERELFGFPSAGFRSTEITGASWSPNGTALAVSTRSLGSQGETSVMSYPIAGGVPTTWFSISDAAVLPGVCTGCGGQDTIASVTGWWPRWGIGFWAFSSGATHNLDDTPLELVTRPGGIPHIIGDTLSDGSTVSYASDSRGELAIVASTGGREYGSGKTVDVCDRSSLTCAPVPGASVWSGKPLPCAGLECSGVPKAGLPGSGVSIDPSWSPNGSLLAYEKAPTLPYDGVSNATWYNAHELYLWNSATNTSKRVATLSGVTVPIWSKNGEDLLYVDNDALWLWRVNGGQPTRVASPLFSPKQWIAKNSGFQFSYYEQVNFSGQFSWWSH
jgi:WD40-like Beta Propeller Repeat